MKQFKLFFIILFSFSFFIPSNSPIKAQEQTRDSSISISATVPDNIDPSTPPILISPTNGSYLSDPTVNFVFEKAVDEQSGIRHYQLFLDGSVEVSEILEASIPYETDDFSVTSSGDEITLSLKRSLSDSSYTWKIRAYDHNDNYADSATWSFSIDTQGPLLVINQVGYENTNLGYSSEDPNSIPEDTTLETYDKTPLFVGRSEPYASVRIVLTDSDSDTTTLEDSAESDGQFTFTPSSDLDTGTYTVTASASDSVGNTTLLSEFYVEVKDQETVTASPSPTPSPSPSASATPAPAASPSPSPSVQELPTPILVSPVNGSYLSDPNITFVYNKVNNTENTLSHYQLYLNNQLKVQEIPVNQDSINTDQYQCVVNNDQYNLTLKQPLSDSIYNWKIRIVDTNDNYADSALWTFSLDTQGPILIINQVGSENKELGYSSKTPTEIPTQTMLSTNDPRPVFAGRSEPGSQIRIVLKNSQNKTTILRGSAKQQGYFEIYPSTNLINDTYTITVSSSDSAGNTTLLPDFKTVVNYTAADAPATSVSQRAAQLFQLPDPSLNRTSFIKTCVLLTIPLIMLLAWYVFAKFGLGFSFALSLKFYLHSSLLFGFITRLFKKHYLIIALFDEKPLRFVEITEIEKIESDDGEIINEKRKILTDKNGEAYFSTPDKREITASRNGFYLVEKSIQEYPYMLFFKQIQGLKKHKTQILASKIFLFLSLLAAVFIMFTFPSLLTLFISTLILDLFLGYLL